MERINLPHGCYWQETNARNAVGNVYNSDGQEIVTSMLRMDAQAISDAMQPTYINLCPIELEPMWNIDVGPCFAVKGIDWLPADKMRDISAFLNHALQAEMSKTTYKIDTSHKHVDGVKVKPHPIECDDVMDESGVVVAKGGNTNGR